MSDFFSKALAAFPKQHRENTFEGQKITIGPHQATVIKKLGSGGFAEIFLVKLAENDRLCAVKRMFAYDKESISDFRRECEFFKKCSGPPPYHPRIVEFYDVAIREENKRIEFLILNELCPGGSIVDMVNRGGLSPSIIAKVFYQTSAAVEHVHRCGLTHRDIKLENFLINAKGRVKLCDFGSATNVVYSSDEIANWDYNRKMLIEEQYQKYTTPMYRTPEVLSLHENRPIGPWQDLWALGCILYQLCYRVHPFEDSVKLRIMNCRYAPYPEDPEDPSLDTLRIFRPVIESCINVEPMQRRTAKQLMGDMENLAPTLKAQPLDGPVAEVNMEEWQRCAAETQAAGQLLETSFSIMKNLKNKTVNLVHQVQTQYGVPNLSSFGMSSRPHDGEMKFNKVCSRLIFVETSGRSLNEDSVIEQLRSKQLVRQMPFLLVDTITQNRNNDLREECHIVPFPATSYGPICVSRIIDLCDTIHSYLASHPATPLVICGSKAACWLIALSIVMGSKKVSSIEEACNILQLREDPCPLPQSWIKIVDTIGYLARGGKNRMSSSCLRLQDIYVWPLPTTDAMSVDVFSNGTVKFTSAPRNLTAVSDICNKISLEVTAEGDGDVYLLFQTTQKDGQKKPLCGVSFNGRLIQGVDSSFEWHLSFQAEDLDSFGVTPGANMRILVSGVNCHGETSGIISRQNFEGFRLENLVSSKEEFASLMSRTPAQTISPKSDVPPPIVFIDNQADAEIAKELFMSMQGTKQVPKAAGAAAEKPADFFNTLSWGGSAEPVTSNTGSAYDLNNPFLEVIKAETEKKETSNATTKSTNPFLVDDGLSTQMGNMNVGSYRSQNASPSDYTPGETPIIGRSSPDILEQVDLLGLGEDLHSSEPIASSQPKPVPADPFADIFGSTTKPSAAPVPNPSSDLFDPFGATPSAPQTVGQQSNTAAPDLLFDVHAIPTVAPARPPAPSQMHRNTSAPAFQKQGAFDPFAEFLNNPSLSNPTSKPNSAHNSASSTPRPQRPNYNRSVFETAEAAPKKKVGVDTFGDLLSQHNFTSSKQNSVRSMGELRKAEEAKNMDPISIKIRDWTDGKEGNIRALLGSLSDVLWEGSRWKQPNMQDLVDDVAVKKLYQRACIVVHPDKMQESEYGELAKAIFTELNVAYNAWTKSSV